MISLQPTLRKLTERKNKNQEQKQLKLEQFCRKVKRIKKTCFVFTTRKGNLKFTENILLVSFLSPCQSFLTIPVSPRVLYPSRFCYAIILYFVCIYT